MLSPRAYFGSLAIIALALLAAPRVSHAILFSWHLNTPGDGLLTRDTDTGLEWLDVPQTAGLSGIVGCSPNGYGDGFSCANSNHVSDLLNHAGIGFHLGNHPANAPGVQKLRELLGDTGNGYLEGIYRAPNSLSSYQAMRLAGDTEARISIGAAHDTFSRPDLGNLVYRAAPSVTNAPLSNQYSVINAGLTANGLLLGGSSQVGGLDITLNNPGDGVLTVIEDALSAGQVLQRVLNGDFDALDFVLPGDTAQLWEVEFIAGTFGESTGAFDDATVTFAYDETLLGGVAEGDLAIYHFSGTGWEKLPVLGRDSLANTITVSTTSFSPLMLGVPEPSSGVFLFAAVASFSAWHFRRHDHSEPKPRLSGAS